uniref:Uncharacterized protein n=1 Tax=Anguilla anguilla TaxID=7936 RepID=A0A0E9PFG9_ANGAN
MCCTLNKHLKLLGESAMK